MSKDNTRGSLSPLQRLTRCLLHLDVAIATSARCTRHFDLQDILQVYPRHTTAFLGYVARGQPPSSVVRATSRWYRGEGTSPFCSTIISFSSGAEGACAGATGGAGGCISLRFEATQICLSCVPTEGDS